MIKLTKKQAKQYEQLSKKIKLSRREFIDFYKDVRKANAKGYRLKKNENAIYTPKYSTKINSIQTREDFIKRRKSVKKVLKRDYRTRINEEMRQRAYSNIRNVLGIKNARPIIERMKQMSNTEYIKFFKDNEDIQSIGYDSDQSLFDFIDETQESFLTRLDTFKL